MTHKPQQLRSFTFNLVLGGASMLATAACSQPNGELTHTGAAIDVHTHLASDQLAAIFGSEGASAAKGKELVARLNEANVDRAVVLAAGYMNLGSEFDMASENDFVADQVGRYPDRLVGFCGINPLDDASVSEVDRCLKRPGMVGIKLNLIGSGVDMTNAEHVSRMYDVFEAIVAHDAPVMLHSGHPSGLPLDSDAFANLADLIEQYPELRITHAHCAGATDDQVIERWLRNDRTSETSFVDTSACLKFFKDAPESTRERIVWQLRRWGIDKVLFGSDYLQFLPEETPLEALDTLTKYPFTQDELDTILNNDASDWIGTKKGTAVSAD